MNLAYKEHEIITGWYGLAPYTDHTHWADIDSITIGTDFATRDEAIATAKARIDAEGEDR